jgi:hypothetical protein
VRTWFYLSDILAWYTEFNRSHTAVYGQFGILPGQDNGRLKLPASTGIRGELSTGAARAMDLPAVAGPAASRPLVRQLSNPGQQDAFQYGSAFSRGALIQQPDVSLVKRPEDAQVYKERAAARGLENILAVIMVADICRDELLYEMDAEVAFNLSRRGC